MEEKNIISRNPRSWHKLCFLYATTMFNQILKINNKYQNYRTLISIKILQGENHPEQIT